ncbi:MAG: calcium-binding protein [Solirubrobacterales bacterium]
MAGIRTGTTQRRATSLAVIGLAAAVLWSMVPEGAEARPKCGGRKATIVRGGGDNVIKAPKKGVQVIVAGAGNDVIVAKRNKDIVCGGDGDDVISGGTGRDRIFGGPGNDLIMSAQGSDKVFAGPGDDTILGGGGGDTIHGEDGIDRILGELQDDHLFGEAGNDLVLGGHGIDQMDGGSEDDWLRGEVNRDSYTGGSGNDTGSFAAATPPGPTNELNGVAVNLASGAAAGDDSAESLGGIENVVGSQFGDQLSGAGGGFVRGGAGEDLCAGFALTDCRGVNRGSGALPLVFVADAATPDPGLVVLGGSGNDNLTASLAGGVLTVSGSPMLAGPGCDGGQVSTTINCTAPAAPLGYVLLWGDAGDDSLVFGSGLSQLTEVKADGGPGSDQLTGGPGADVLYPGETGSDRLVGGDGDDALIGRGGGGDTLEGQGGSDNLVSNNPCDGHTYVGGPGGADVAGFGHVTIGGVQAKLNGSAQLRGSGGCSPTRIRGSEVLEGSIGNDKLVGTRHFDLLIGREGNDVLVGKGGRDDFRGDAGRDRCVGKGQKRSC